MGCCGSKVDTNAAAAKKVEHTPDSPGDIVGSVYEAATGFSGASFRPSTAAFSGYGRKGKLHTGHRVIVTEDHVFMCMFEGINGVECANHLVRTAYGCWNSCRVRCAGDNTAAINMVMQELDDSLMLASAASTSKAMSGAAAAIAVVDLRTHGLHASAVGGCSVLVARVTGSFNHVTPEAHLVADGRLHRAAAYEMRDAGGDVALLHRCRAYVLGFGALKSRKAQELYARLTGGTAMMVQEPVPPLQVVSGSCQLMLGDEHVFLVSSGFQDLVGSQDVPILAHEFLPDEMQVTLEAAHPRIVPYLPGGGLSCSAGGAPPGPDARPSDSGSAPMDGGNVRTSHARSTAGTRRAAGVATGDSPLSSHDAHAAAGGAGNTTDGALPPPSPHLSMGSITSDGTAAARTPRARRTPREQLLAYDGAAPTPLSMSMSAQRPAERMRTRRTSLGSGGGSVASGATTTAMSAGAAAGAAGRARVTNRHGHAVRDSTMARAVRGRFNVSQLLVSYAAGRLYDSQDGQVSFHDHRTAQLFSVLRSDVMVVGLSAQFPRSFSSQRQMERKKEMARRCPTPLVAYRWHLCRQYVRFLIARRRAIRQAWHNLMRSMVDMLDQHARDAEVLTWRHMAEAVKVTREGTVMQPGAMASMHRTVPLPQNARPAVAPSYGAYTDQPYGSDGVGSGGRPGPAPLPAPQPAPAPHPSRQPAPAPRSALTPVAAIVASAGGATAVGRYGGGGRSARYRSPPRAKPPAPLPPPPRLMYGQMLRDTVNTSPTSRHSGGKYSSRNSPDSDDYEHDVSYLAGPQRPKQQPQAPPPQQPRMPQQQQQQQPHAPQAPQQPQPVYNMGPAAPQMPASFSAAVPTSPAFPGAPPAGGYYMIYVPPAGTPPPPGVPVAPVPQYSQQSAPTSPYAYGHNGQTASESDVRINGI